jgi:hypothetical protein
MRDAAAKIDFRGNDVDVDFSTGSVFLPDGGSVAASNGVFTIRDAYTPVVIGQLEVDVAGDAARLLQVNSHRAAPSTRPLLRPRDDRPRPKPRRSRSVAL